MKISKQNRKRHNAALELLAKEKLDWDEQQFFFDNYFECADFDVGHVGAFFTPTDMALDAALEVGQTDRKCKVLDLCAGIGVLSWAMLTRFPNAEITAIEQNPKWVEIGKKLLPQVNWICADLADVDFAELGYFHYALINPPFGKVKSLQSLKCPRYTGSEAHYKVIDIACVCAGEVVAIIPQQSCAWRYSHSRCFQEQTSPQLERFVKETGIVFGMNMGIDTSAYEQFKATTVNVEIVRCEYEHVSWDDFAVEAESVTEAPLLSLPVREEPVTNVVSMPVSQPRTRKVAVAVEQMDLFG